MIYSNERGSVIDNNFTIKELLVNEKIKCEENPKYWYNNYMIYLVSGVKYQNLDNFKKLLIEFLC